MVLLFLYKNYYNLYMELGLKHLKKIISQIDNDFKMSIHKIFGG
ncbi:hypothetical protein CLSA_c40510 [Clostridium saccharobutylicum DSM 13864]|uniref:Uncharacterized protein n=1 Tax=Clostridium saccharobutylicum DSM 13864 TaxID=1345695 RepID=U5MZC3_CLOSA|nr:hypothetical protein CLSA_c40510 [Clostridium saccharobutylicum DSM 13864]